MKTREIIPRISNRFLIHLDRIYMERGGDLFKIMKQADLPYETLIGEGIMVPFESHMKMLELSENELDVRPLGLVLAARQFVSHLAPLFDVLLNQADVESSILALCENLRQVAEGIEAHLSVDSEIAYLEISTNYDFLYQSSVFHDHGAGLLAQYLRWIVGKKFRLRSVSLPHSEPRNLQRFRSFFGCPISFGDKHMAICFDKDTLSKSVVGRADKYGREYNEVLEWDRHSRLLPKLRSVIRGEISSGSASASYVADKMGMSKRTLQRRLYQHGTSFNQQLDSVRAGLARRYIYQQDLELAHVSVNLGYTDQSCFTKAFKRWYRQTPSQSQIS